jgi:hypothetical protein
MATTIGEMLAKKKDFKQNNKKNSSKWSTTNHLDEFHKLKQRQSSCKCRCRVMKYEVAR